MYYSDSRFVCNADNCEVRTRDNPLLQFQTVIKGKVVILGFHQDCGLPSNAQKCQMIECNIYLDSLCLNKINRMNIGYCSRHSYKIETLWKNFNSLSEEERNCYERQFFYELECEEQEIETVEDDFNSYEESEFIGIKFDTFKDELTNNLNHLYDPLLDHLDEKVRLINENKARDDALLKAHQHAEDIRRGIKPK